MIAVIGGLGAALCWAISTLLGARVSRAVGPAAALAWNMGLGLLMVLPWVIFGGIGWPQGSQWWWIVLVGASTLLGFLCEYEGFHHGPMGLIGAIASTEGAIAALIAIATGETPSMLLVVALPVLTIGLMMVMLPTGVTHLHASNWPRAVAFACGSAVFFGLSLYSAGRVAGTLPITWALLPSRAMGTAFVLVPLAAMSKIAIPRKLVPFAVATGLADLVGFVLFALGSRDGIGVAAILAAQFGVVAAVVAALFLHERLSVRQAIGVGIVGLGVALVAASSAG